MWDEKRQDKYLYPDPLTLTVKDPLSLKSDNRYSVVIPCFFVQGRAYGSSARSVGLMLATTPYVTFADSDVWWEKDHLETLLASVKGKEWAYCKRKIWKSSTDYIGIDNFESVGDSSTRKVPYEMVDNNCMIFSRRFGTSGAVLYRERNGEYNDDRLFYKFLKQYAGEPGKTGMATVNQICPVRLQEFFMRNCDR